MYCEAPSPIEMGSSNKRTTRTIDNFDTKNGDNCTQTGHRQHSLRWIERPTWSRVDKHTSRRSGKHTEKSQLAHIAIEEDKFTEHTTDDKCTCKRTREVDGSQYVKPCQ